MPHANKTSLLAIMLAFALTSLGCSIDEWEESDTATDTATDGTEDTTVQDVPEDTTADTVDDVVEDTPMDTVTDVVEDTPMDTITDVVEDTMADPIDDVVDDGDAPMDTTEEEFIPDCSVDGDCDDSDPCTMDTCDTGAGVCENVPMDADSDTYAAAEVDGTTCEGGTDCDDGNPDIHPGAAEICDLVDDDCDGSIMDATGMDDDDDTYIDEDCGGDDCDDRDSSIHPDAIIVDIAQETHDDHLNMDPWQSFTPTMDGRITSIEMRPNIYISGGGTVTGDLTIYSGEGVSGTVLHTQAYSLTSAGGMPWQTFVLTTPLVVSAGTVYTWELTGVTSMAHSTSDVYAGGRASSSAYDMVFRVNLEVCI